MGCVRAMELSAASLKFFLAFPPKKKSAMWC